jgi:hypothetical protein
VGEVAERHTSGAEARVESAWLMSGLKPGPTARTGFSAAFEVVPFQTVSTPTGKMLQVDRFLVDKVLWAAPKQVYGLALWLRRKERGERRG